MKKVILFLSLIIFDQLLKTIARKSLLESGLLKYVCNKNIAWSIPIAPGVFYFIWIIVFVFLVYFFVRSKNNLEKYALLFIVSGAVSNIADRIIHGCVIDFIDLKFWPVFNLADVYITIGVILLIATVMKINRTA